MMVQQSNCFVIVERGRAMKAMTKERELMNSGELRSNSNYGKGQMVTTDYTLSPSVQFEQSNMGKIGGFARRLLPTGVPGLGYASVGAKSNEASTTLLMIDNRSGVQVSSSTGSAKNFDFSFFGSSWGHGAWGSARGFSDTPEGKVIIASFGDSYNQMVMALREYKPQKVKGGLGTGGALKVDGAVDAKPKPSKPQSSVTTKPITVASSDSGLNVRASRYNSVSVDAYDRDALEDYYKALKRSVEGLSNYSNFTPAQIQSIESQSNAAGISGLWALMWGTQSGKLETSKIELEAWPYEAKQKGWSIFGKLITKYNKLFEKYRNEIISNEAWDKSVRNKLASVELLTQESLFEE
jgi:hypothetical protein